MPYYTLVYLFFGDRWLPHLVRLVIQRLFFTEEWERPFMFTHGFFIQRLII